MSGDKPKKMNGSKPKNTPPILGLLANPSPIPLTSKNFISVDPATLDNALVVDTRQETGVGGVFDVVRLQEPERRYDGDKLVPDAINDGYDGDVDDREYTPPFT